MHKNIFLTGNGTGYSYKLKVKIRYPLQLQFLTNQSPRYTSARRLQQTDMATNSKKAVKSAVSSEKKSKRGEETPSADPLKDESLFDIQQQSEEKLVPEEKAPEEGIDTDVQILKEPSPEPEYEEAVLTKIIVER